MLRKGVTTVLVLLLAAVLSTTAAPIARSDPAEARPKHLGAPPATLLDCAPGVRETVSGDAQPTRRSRFRRRFRFSEDALITGSDPPAVDHTSVVRTVNRCLAELPTPEPAPATELRFVSTWEPAEIDLVLDAVARFERALGGPRLRELIRIALDAHSLNVDQLTFFRGPDGGTPAAFWAPYRGRIVLNDSLFDATFLRINYVWMVFYEWRDTAPDTVTIQDAIVAHELGHVVVDALRAEQKALDPDGPTLESLYSHRVDPLMWPHPGGSAEENLATEFALLALGLERPGTAGTFRREVLVPALEARLWPVALELADAQGVVQGALLLATR